MSKKIFIIIIILFFAALIGIAIYRKVSEGDNDNNIPIEEVSEDYAIDSEGNISEYTFPEEQLEFDDEEKMTADSASEPIKDLQEYTLTDEDNLQVLFEDDDTILLDGKDTTTLNYCNSAAYIRGRYKTHVVNFMCLNYRKNVIEGQENKQYAVLRYARDFDEENLDNLDYEILNSEILVEVDSLKGKDIMGKEVEFYVSPKNVVFVTYPYSVVSYMDIAPVFRLDETSNLIIKE